MFHRLKTAPWRKVFKGLGWFILAFTLLLGLPDGVMHYSSEGLAGVLEQLGVAAIAGSMLALVGLYLFAGMWALHDVPKGWADTKQFVRDFPENWRAFWRGVGAVMMLLVGLPGMLLRGLATALRFVASLPAMWRALSKRERQATLAFIGSVAVWIALGYYLWLPSLHFVQWLPTWLQLDNVFMATLFVDMFLSAFAMILTCHLIVPIAFILLRALFRRRSRD